MAQGDYYTWENQNVDENFLKNFTGAQNPVKFITGDPQLGAQQQYNAYQLLNKIQSFSNSYYQNEVNKLKAINPNINVDAFINPEYKLYDAGEGADSNRGAPIEKAHLELKAKMDALDQARKAVQQYQSTGQMPTAPNYVDTVLKPKLDQAKAAATAGWRDPWLKLQVDRIQSLIDGSGQLNAEGMAQANAAAARVGAPLPYPNEKIGNIVPGGAINNDNKDILPYDQLATNVQNGKPASYTPFDPNNTIYDKGDGNFVFRGMSYRDLNAAQSAAKKAQVQNPFVTKEKPVMQGSSPLNNIYDNGDGTYTFRGMTYRGLSNAQGAAQNWGIATPNVVQQTKQIPAESGAPSNYQDVNTPDDLNKWLDSLTSTALDNANASSAPPVRGTSTDTTNGSSYFSNLLNAKNEPTPLNSEQKLGQLRDQYGVASLEAQLNDLDKQANDLQAATRIQALNEEGKPVAMNVIQGRISEEQRVAMQKLDFINSQRSYIQDQLKTKYGLIDTYMNAAKLDYTTAVDKYNNDFNRNLQIISLMRSVQQDNRNQQSVERDDARANFQILANSISSGALDWSKATPAQRALGMKLETQAGLPPGTLDNYARKSAGWEMKTILPGVDDQGHAINTILEYNKLTGEYKTSNIRTDYSPTSGANSDSNILSKSERTDKGGTKVLDIVYKDGTTKSIPLGSTNSETANDKNAEEFNKFRTDIVGQLYSSDPLKKIDMDTAKRLVRARYPSMTEENLNKFLAL